MTNTEGATADQHFTLTFATRAERPVTHWIEGEYDADGPRPEAFFEAMAAIGFVEDASFAALPPYTSREAGCRVQEFSLTQRGTALFGGWTPEEKKTHMTAARKVMRQHGFVKVPVWRKTFADMI